MTLNEEIRSRVMTWPPQYQIAVYHYAQTGNVAKAAKAAGIQRQTLSKHINHGYYKSTGELVFSTMDWLDVVSIIKQTETLADVRTMGQFLMGEVIGNFGGEAFWKNIDDEIKQQILKDAMDFSKEATRLTMDQGPRPGTSRVLMDVQTSDGDMPPEIVEFARERLHERFKLAREKEIKELDVAEDAKNAIGVVGGDLPEEDGEFPIMADKG